jgi:Cof subfamily protein (haloacid dehalogenase superfamily)
MYKAVFIDMDGTLLRKDHTISDATRQVIQKLLKQGIMIVPVSARPLHAILPIINPVIDNSMPIISLNGSYIYLDNEIIHQVIISLHDTIHVQHELQDYDASVMYYSQMEWFTTRESELVKKEQKITTVQIKVYPFPELVREWRVQQNGPNKILIAGDKELVKTIEQRLLELYNEKLNIYQSQPGYLEVMNQAASKTTGIQFLLSKYGIQQNEIIAIGDNFNDKGMIEFAGMGVAMGNAPDEIKSVADYVTDTNNNDGVAKALNHFFR